MKKFILHLIFTIFIFVNFSHNPVMAFGDKISFSMGNHNIEIQNIPDCHHPETSDFFDCESICCYDRDYTTNNSLISNFNQTTNKKVKIIISFFDIGVLDNLFFDWNFVGNTSPPDTNISFKIQENIYIKLVGKTKSNT